MAIDDSGDWWVGSEPADIEAFLVAYTRAEGSYPVVATLSVGCSCGSDRFRLVRSLGMTQRTCSSCGNVRYICRSGDPIHWAEAVQEESPEPYACVSCGGAEVNVVVGFARFDDPELDSVKWFYVGVRCAHCGVLGCFNDDKVGRGPKAEVQQKIIG